MTDLTLHITQSPDSWILDEFLVEYDKAFVLPDEKETSEGFRQCMLLNEGGAHDRLVSRFGPFGEFVIVAKDSQGRFVGGINMLAYRAPEAGENGDDLFGIALNYAFVAKAFRRQGHLGKLVQIAREVAADALNARPEAFLVFLEINNPTKMSQEDIHLDSELSGIDQDARLLVWERIGASVIDVDYVQPPLSDDGQAPETRLLLAVIAPTPRQQLDSERLRAHLERFFGISVLKGKDLPEVAMAQIQACQARHDGYALLAPSGFVRGSAQF